MPSLLLWIGATLVAAGSPPDVGWWDVHVDRSLDRAPAHKKDWVGLLETCRPGERAGLAYLLRYLPRRDLESMRPEVLANNLALAYQARNEVPWGTSLPDEIFLDAVLPYASVTERRQSLRAEFHGRYLPLVKVCKTPGQAAHALNKALFSDYKVVYNTRRLRTDQSSPESIAQGMATCTGLSIMLVEACRSVGVPARMAGISSWPGRGGNHTWVEVWDNGWHFVGAAEPDANGLDHAWFADDAAKAVKGSPKSAIYAVTYRETGAYFPMVWDPSARVPGEDVTDRYARGGPVATAKPRLMVEFRRQGNRPPSEEARAELARIFGDRFGSDQAKRETARKPLAELPWDESLREIGWSAYKTSPVHESLRHEFEAKTVVTKERKSPYLWRHVGKKPVDGWALVIAMHGGGGAPGQVNDQQWRSMFERYYKEHPEAGGYVYLALRAPNDEWNGFYDDAICPLVERLIRQFVLFDDVNPDRVYSLGASHGGYGAFVIGPKMPDRFAAVHASAAAATPDETHGENLRNVRFTVMVGEKDTAYGRAERCRAFTKELEGWKTRFGGYPGGVVLLPGVGHSVPDRDKVGEMMMSGTRVHYPDRIVWAQSDDVLTHFYWIEAPRPNSSGRVEATVRDNTITLKLEHQDEVVLWLDAPLVNLARPVTVELDGGRREEIQVSPKLETFCVSLEERGDPRLAAPVRLAVPSRR